MCTDDDGILFYCSGVDGVREVRRRVRHVDYVRVQRYLGD